LEETARQELTDLVRKMKNDQNTYFPPFYEKTKSQVYYLILSYVRNTAVAEDLLQDTYLSFLRSLSKLSVQKNPVAYLLTSAKNHAIDSLREQTKFVDDGDEILDYVGASEFIYDDSDGLLKRIAQLLNPLEFRTYALHVLGDMSFQEIAAIVHRPLGTLTYTYSTAIHKLQKGLDSDGNIRV